MRRHGLRELVVPKLQDLSFASSEATLALNLLDYVSNLSVAYSPNRFSMSEN